MDWTVQDKLLRLHTIRDPDGYVRGFVSVRRLNEDGLPTLLGQRIQLPDRYRGRSELQTAALKMGDRIISGEVAARVTKVTVKHGDYKLTGYAAFHVGRETWQACLDIERLRPVEKRAKQSFSGEDSTMPELTHQVPERAAQLGVEYGERMVLGYVGGLKI